MAFTGAPFQACQRTTDITPGAVQNLMVMPVSYSSIIATWDAPANYRRPGLNYSITVEDDMGMVVISDGVSVNQQSYFASELNAQSRYTVTVAAISAEGKGSVAQQSGSTLLPPPPPPTNVELSFVGPTLNVTWSDTTADDYFVTSYDVCWRCNELGGCENASVKETSIDIAKYVIG